MFRDVSSGVVRWQDTKRGESHLTQMKVAELLQTTQAVYESIQTLSKKTANVYGTTRIMFERDSSKKRIIKKIAEGVSGRSDSSMQHLKKPTMDLALCVHRVIVMMKQERASSEPQSKYHICCNIKLWIHWS